MPATADAAENIPYLRSRALWCSAQFAEEVIDAKFAPFLQAAVEVLQPGRPDPLPMKIAACKAVWKCALLRGIRTSFQELMAVR